MGPGKRESNRVVIESCRNPGGRVVTLLARLRKTKLEVAGIGGLLKIGQMATHTLRRSAFVLSSNVALGALQSCVRADQGESSEFKMVKVGPEPVVHPVALLTGSREPGGCVARR